MFSKNRVVCLKFLNQMLFYIHERERLKIALTRKWDTMLFLKEKVELKDKTFPDFEKVLRYSFVAQNITIPQYLFPPPLDSVYH